MLAHRDVRMGTRDADRHGSRRGQKVDLRRNSSTFANEDAGRSQRMLVLSRQRDETIMIGDDIEVTVVDIRGDKVRLGINAPKSISVHRKEVYDAIRRENREAAQVKPEDLSGFGKIKPNTNQNPGPQGPEKK